jgi:hypothetical protein
MLGAYPAQQQPIFFPRTTKLYWSSSAYSKTLIGLFYIMARLYLVGLAIGFVVLVGALTFLAFSL